jgi:hypothetical protein
MDVTGKNYTRSITLAPYSSVVLIYISGTPVSMANKEGQYLVGAILLQIGLSALMVGQRHQPPPKTQH